MPNNATVGVTIQGKADFRDVIKQFNDVAVAGQKAQLLLAGPQGAAAGAATGGQLVPTAGTGVAPVPPGGAPEPKYTMADFLKDLKKEFKDFVKAVPDALAALAVGLMRSGKYVGAAARAVGAAASQVGATGDVLQAGTDILGGLGSTVSRMGPVGEVLGGVMSAVSGVGSMINDISRTYEGFIPTLMDTSAAFGQLNGNIADNSRTFHDNLSMAADAAAHFGYSIEQSLSIVSGLSHGGMGATAAAGATTNIMAYARQYGVQNMDLLTQSSIMGARYTGAGGAGAAMGYAAGAVNAQQGMGPGRFEEQLQGMMTTFESALSRGVTLGFQEIAKTSNFFGSLGGQTWQGALGQQRVAQLTNAMNQSTNLTSDRDVIMFRAAQMGHPGESYIHTQERMEGQMTPEMFHNVGMLIQQMTGNNNDAMITMFKQQFGVSVTTADQLVQMFRGGTTADTAQALSLLPDTNIANSPELQLVDSETQLRKQIITLGETMLSLKEGFISSVSHITEDFAVMARRMGPMTTTQTMIDQSITRTLGPNSAFANAGGAFRPDLATATGAMTNVLQRGEFVPEDTAAVHRLLALLQTTGVRDQLVNATSTQREITQIASTESTAQALVDIAAAINRMHTGVVAAVNAPVVATTH